MKENGPHIETAERVRKKSGGKKLSSVSWLAGVIFVLGLSIMAGFYWEQQNTVTEVRFSGNYFTETSQLESIMPELAGQKADSLNYQELIRTITNLSYIHSATLWMDARGVLSFHVNERQPIGMIMNRGRRVYFDSEGKKLPIVLGKNVDVPLVYGFEIEPLAENLSSPEFLQVRNFLMTALNNPIGKVTISEVAWSPDDGVVALSHENGVKLVFGSNDFDRKLTYWENFYAEVIRTHGIQKFQTVDLRFKNQIVTRET